VQLQQLGWNAFFENQLASNDLIPARVSEQNKGFHKVLCEKGEFLANVAGKVHFRAENRSDYPAVGDWVLLRSPLQGTNASIETILTRRTRLSRKNAGRTTKEQVLCANMDIVFVVTSLNQEFNLRRVERYLTSICDSGAMPVLLLNKADLCSSVADFRQAAEQVATGVPVHAISATQGQGMAAFSDYLNEDITAVFVGSSGVGKSTIINALTHGENQRTSGLSADDRGTHTTTSRQMLLLPKNGIVIDTPGMREFALWTSDGLTETFSDVSETATQCRFRDCKHESEPGCAVKLSIENNELDAARLESFRKLQAELKYLQRKTDPREKRKAKSYEKKIGKFQKEFYKGLKGMR
jgi:ribosome biogenesis GTPase / thiamine phosphate phosphatase